MKQVTDRWQSFKRKALSRKRQPLSRGQQSSWARVNGQEQLLFALCSYLERSPGLTNEPKSAEAELLVMAIHDWKESIRDVH